MLPEVIMKKVFKVEGIDCANCAKKAERGIAAIDGVINADINFITLKMKLECEDGKFEEIEPQMMKILRKIEPDVQVKAL